MQDVVFLVVLVGFFALAILFVMGCDRIIGRDEEALADGAGGTPVAEPVIQRLGK
jgi:hypothetical protein